MRFLLARNHAAVTRLTGRLLASEAGPPSRRKESDSIVRRIDLSNVARPVSKDFRVKVPAPKLGYTSFPLFDPRIHIRPKTERETRLLSDGSTIFCYHPEVKMPFEATRPLREEPQFAVDFREDITEEEAVVLRQLREQDPDKYTTGALARIFRVKPYVVMRLAPTPAARIEKLKAYQQELDSVKQAYKRKKMERERKKAALRNLDQAVIDGLKILKRKGLLPEQNK